MKILTALRQHYPEYLIEAWALGMFMISAGVFTILLEHPDSAVRALVENPHVRRALAGLAMGVTAVALIYSPWGKRSGAHMNPAVTLSFLRLGKVAPIDAGFYIVAQFVGGLAGVLVVAAMFGMAFTAPPVNYVQTLPGEPGVGIALAAEALISFGMMFTVLVVSNNARLAAATGLFAGTLVAIYITFEGPLSGMSINPARSMASAAPAGNWSTLWIYFTAPFLGMLAAAEVYVRALGTTAVHCGKLLHPDDQRCIHCGYEPEMGAEAAGRDSLVTGET